MRKILSFVFLSLFFIACSSDDDLPSAQNNNNNNNNGSSGNTASQTFGIRHDRMLSDYEKIATNVAPYTTSTHPNFASVVMFSYSLDGSNQSQFVATGTLINKDWVLTAAHNFFVSKTSDPQQGQDSPAKPEGVTVVIGNDPNNADAIRKVENIVFHPTWETQQDGFYNGNDICLVKLKTPVTNIIPAKWNARVDAEALDSEVWYAGFGDYSQTLGQDKKAFSKKHAFHNILDRRVDGIETKENDKSYNGGLLAFDFDNPDATINSFGDDLVNQDEKQFGDGDSDPTPLKYEGTTVTGDSGGPIFVKVGNEWLVAGVLNGGVADPIKNHKDSSYGDISVFIRTASHKDWLNSVLNP